MLGILPATRHVVALSTSGIVGFVLDSHGCGRLEPWSPTEQRDLKETDVNSYLQLDYIDKCFARGKTTSEVLKELRWP